MALPTAASRGQPGVSTCSEHIHAYESCSAKADVAPSFLRHTAGRNASWRWLLTRHPLDTSRRFIALRVYIRRLPRRRLRLKLLTSARHTQLQAIAFTPKQSRLKTLDTPYSSDNPSPRTPASKAACPTTKSRRRRGGRSPIGWLRQERTLSSCRRRANLPRRGARRKKRRRRAR